MGRGAIYFLEDELSSQTWLDCSLNPLIDLQVSHVTPQKQPLAKSWCLILSLSFHCVRLPGYRQEKKKGTELSWLSDPSTSWRWRWQNETLIHWLHSEWNYSGAGLLLCDECVPRCHALAVRLHTSHMARPLMHFHQKAWPHHQDTGPRYNVSHNLWQRRRIQIEEGLMTNIPLIVMSAWRA